MGGKKKKHWIDKNKSVTYQLVHRDQRDPLAADTDNSTLVLAPVKAYGKKVTPDMYDSLMERFFPEGRPAVDEKGKAELETQDHMEDSLSDSDDEEYIFKRFTKPIGTATGGVFINKTGEILEEPPAWNLQDIPSDVLPSRYEEDEGILSRGLNDVIDEEIEEALEYFDEGNYEELADDFVGELVKLSNAEAQADGEELYPEIPSNASSTEEEDYGDLDDIEGLIPNLKLPPGAKVQVFEEEEERERTELDVAFDKALEQFDEESEGDSEDGPNPDACGHESIKAYTQVLDDFLERQAPIAYRHEPIQCRIWEPKKSIIEPERQRIPKAEEVIIFHEDEEIPEGGYDSADEDLKLQLTETITLQNKELTWDCETIITTYTNTENHPALIAEPQTGLKIRLAKKTGAPLIAEFTVPSKKDVEVEEDEEPKENLGLARPQDESPESKKARKQQAKEARKIAREKKKSLRTEYKTEEVKIRAENIGNLKGATVVSYGVR